jgi:hypothetical protein
LEDDGVEDASLHASWRDKAEIPPIKKMTDKQTNFMVNLGHKNHKNGNSEKSKSVDSSLTTGPRFDFP